MRIAIYTETFLPQVDGVTNLLCRILPYFQRAGHETLLLAPGGGPREYGGAKIVGLPAIPFYPTYPEFRVAIPTYKVLSKVAAFRPDLFIVVNPLLMAGSAILIARLLRKPTLGLYCTDIPEYAERYGFHFLVKPAWRYLRWMHNACDLNLVPSNATMAQLHDHGFERLALAAHGVDADMYRATPARRARGQAFFQRGGSDETVILYIGRLAQEKGLDNLRRLADIPGARVVFVGDGPARESLEHLFAGTDTLFTGYLRGEDLYSAYAAGDVFVFPSNTDTFGQVILEAMAAGLPVVGARAGGAIDLIEHGSSGFLYDSGDTDQMVHLVTTLAGNPALRAAMSERAKTLAEGRSWPRAVGELLDFMETLTAGQEDESTGPFPPIRQYVGHMEPAYGFCKTVAQAVGVAGPAHAGHSLRYAGRSTSSWVTTRSRSALNKRFW